MSVSKDLVVESHRAIYTKISGKTVTGSVTLQNAGAVGLSSVNADMFPQLNRAYAIMSGQFSISSDDVLTSIYFRMSGNVTVYTGSSFYTRTFVWEFRVSGSKPLTAGTYVVVVRSEYAINQLNVYAPS